MDIRPDRSARPPRLARWVEVRPRTRRLHRSEATEPRNSLWKARRGRCSRGGFMGWYRRHEDSASDRAAAAGVASELAVLAQATEKRALRREIEARMLALRELAAATDAHEAPTASWPGNEPGFIARLPAASVSETVQCCSRWDVPIRRDARLASTYAKEGRRVHRGKRAAPSCPGRRERLRC